MAAVAHELDQTQPKKQQMAITAEDVQKNLHDFSPDALYQLAVLLYKGNGCPKNDIEAAKLFGLAAEKGHIESQYSLACMLENGIGIAKNQEAAVFWHTRAAHAGYAKSQNNLAIFYEEGNGVVKNLATAFFWFSQSAKQGYPNAMLSVAGMYRKGLGTTADLRKAAKLYLQLAHMGHIESQYIIGIWCKNGLIDNNKIIIKKDLEMAEKWLQQCALQGDAFYQYKYAVFLKYDAPVKDVKTATEFLMSSAAQGFVEAQEELSSIDETGANSENGFGKETPAHLENTASETAGAGLLFGLQNFKTEEKEASGASQDKKAAAGAGMDMHKQFS